MMIKLLLTGANGQLGHEIIARCPSTCSIVALPHEVLDISDSKSCDDAVRVCKPDWVINAAAYTNVEKAEDEPEIAMRINRDGPLNLARAVQRAGARLLHISSDFVFDGLQHRPYLPEDATNPLSVYGKSKLAGEKAVLSVLGNDALIMRTSWLYSAAGKNFLNTTLGLLRDQPFLQIVSDQTGSPTSAVSLTKAVFSAIAADARGIFHWSDDGTATWYDFACEIQKQALALQLVNEKKEIRPVSSSELKCKAVRPPWSVLDKASFIAATGLMPQAWQTMLEKTLIERKAA